MAGMKAEWSQTADEFVFNVLCEHQHVILKQKHSGTF